jgi:hypothetical protein
VRADGRRRNTWGVQGDELGHCIRAWRDRLDPGGADLSAGPRRRAPGLRREERRHLYLVAGQAPSGSGRIDRHITPGVQRMFERLDEMAVVVYDAIWEVVAWNPLGAALVGDLETPSGRERNLVWRQFHGGVSRFRRSDECNVRFEAELVADLHAAVADHPEVGPITVDRDVLAVQGNRLRRVVYSAAPGTADAEALALLGVVGLQRMAG